MSKLSLVLGIALIPVGLAAAVLVHPLATGAEELVRWQTIVFANKTALYFMLLMAIGGLGGYYWGRVHSPISKVAVACTTVTIFLLVGWMMSLMSPFDIALQ